MSVYESNIKGNSFQSFDPVVGPGNLDFKVFMLVQASLTESS